MSKFTKMCINVDIEEAIEMLKQMNSAILDSDAKGAEHFLDRINDLIMQIEDGMSELSSELLYDEA